MRFLLYSSLTLVVLSCSSLPSGTDPEKLAALSNKIPEGSATATSEVRAGIEALARKDYKQANDHFSEALRYEPTSGPMHFLNGLAYHLRAEAGDTSQIEFAEVGYQLALKFDPKQPWAAQQMGRLRFRQKDYREAQNQFAYALLFDKGDASLFHNLAVASYYSNDLVTSGQAIQKALELEPANPRYRATEIVVQAASGRGEEATKKLELYTKASSLQNKPELAYQDFLRRRIGDWNEFYQRGAAYRVAENTTVETATDISAQKSGNKEEAKEMCLIDVVLISSNQISQSNKGVNLLSGLQMQFGGSANFGNNWGVTNTQNGNHTASTPLDPDASSPLSHTAGFNNTRQNTNGKTQALTAAITIPTINYNLNIFNNASDRNEVLARPTLVAMDGQASEFFSGATLRVGLTGNVGTNNVVQEIPIGVKLVVTPKFIADDKIQLQVESSREFAENSAATSTFTQSLSTSKTRVLANVTMGFSETLILSGLTEKETSKIRSGVPFLQDIPLLQYFFSNEKTAEFNKTVLILLTPHHPRYTDRDGKESSSVAKSDETPANLKRLKNRSDLFSPPANVDAILKRMEGLDTYTQFRSGDLSLEKWNDFDSLSGRISQSLDFLYY